MARARHWRRTDGDDDEDDEEGHHVRDDLLEHVDQEAEEFEPAQEGDNLPAAPVTQRRKGSAAPLYLDAIAAKIWNVG
jgi:hypothetical protein